MDRNLTDRELGVYPPEPPAQPEADPPAESAPPRRRLPQPQLGRRLRVLAGVDERLLDRVPQERAWYTSLGGVVLGTATIAAISMYFAITQAMGASSRLAVFPVLVWFLFIPNVDRWLVSRRLGEGWFRRMPVEILEHKAELNSRLHRAADRLSERV